MRKLLSKQEIIEKHKKHFREEFAERVISISGSLLQKGKGSELIEFREDLNALLKKHGVILYPYLNFTVVRKNGKVTPIAAP